MAVHVGAEARADVRAITAHIAKHDRLAARRWAIRVEASFARLGEMPGSGAPRFEVRPGLRIRPIGAYLILYRQEGGDAVILRVVHGARRWENLLP